MPMETMMRKVILILTLLGILAACSPAGTQALPTLIPTQVPPTFTAVVDLASATPVTTPTVEPSATPEPTNDFFTQMGIVPPAPVCNGLTQAQMEGPYYKPETPERNSLWEEGMQGTRLILVGYVLDQNCQPLPQALLDFWQADANGEYDNAGYRLRGHQFTDAQGRYYLETVLPGLYASRPIEHIHVKVRPAGGQEITSQLYFPQRPVEGLTVNLEDRGDYTVGYFNFVVQK
jgi:protocatechuate 3,4-dioxygenase beta subunit